MNDTPWSKTLMQFKGLCCTSAFVYMLCPLHLTIRNASLIAKWQTLRTYFTSTYNLQLLVSCIQDHRIRINNQLPVYQDQNTRIGMYVAPTQVKLRHQTQAQSSELRVLRTTPYIYIHSTSFVPLKVSTYELQLPIS